MDLSNNLNLGDSKYSYHRLNQYKYRALAHHDDEHSSIFASQLKAKISFIDKYS